MRAGSDTGPESSRPSRLSAHAQYRLRLIVERRVPWPIARHVGPHQLDGADSVPVQSNSQAKMGVGLVHLHDLYRRDAQKIEAGSRSQLAVGHRLVDEMIQQDERAFRRHTGSNELR